VLRKKSKKKLAKKKLSKKKQAAKAKPKARKRKGKAAKDPALVAAIDQRLRTLFPAPKTELDFQNPWQLVIATILSAQSNDKTINKATPELFRRYPTPAALAAADQEDVEKLVFTTGFYRNKAKAIREASQTIAERFGGEVPRTIGELTEVHGVARKTANVVLASAYRIGEGVIVDRHAARVSLRLGLTASEDATEVEQDLCALFPKEIWVDLGHRLVLHGRYVCTAKKPACADCPLNELCMSREAEPTDPDWMRRAERERTKVDARGAVDD
jgi:endonuclease-3